MSRGRERSRPMRLSNLSHTEFAYEEPSLETQVLSNITIEPDSPDSEDSEDVAPIGRDDLFLDSHEWLQGLGDNFCKSDPALPNTVNNRRYSRFIEDLPYHIPSLKSTQITSSNDNDRSSIGFDILDVNLDPQTVNRLSQEPVPGFIDPTIKDHDLDPIIQYIRQASIDDTDVVDTKSNLSQDSTIQRPREPSLERSQTSKTRGTRQHSIQLKDKNDIITDRNSSPKEVIGDHGAESPLRVFRRVEFESQARPREGSNDQSVERLHVHRSSGNRVKRNRHDDCDNDLNTPNMTSSLTRPSSNFLPEDVGNMTSIERFDLPKMPGTYPRSPSPEYESENEAHIVPKSTESYHGETGNILSAQKDPNSMESDHEDAPRKRLKRIAKIEDSTSSHRVQESLHITDQAQGITDDNKPDPFKRLFSTIKVQNEPLDQYKARKHRRREIIREDDSPDDDMACMGEPKKITFLYQRGLIDKSKGCEPMSEEQARQLMSRGRDTNYAEVPSVSGSCSDKMEVDEPHNDSGTVQQNSRAMPPPPRPGLTRGKPLSTNGGVAMSRGGIEMERSGKQGSAQRTPVVELRGLEKMVDEILMQINERSTQELKEQLAYIRDKAVTMRIPATKDNRRRASKIIRGIVFAYEYEYNAMSYELSDNSHWFEHDDYNPERFQDFLDEKFDEITLKIATLPDGKQKDILRQERLEVEELTEKLQSREEFYDEAFFDNQEFDEFYGEIDTVQDQRLKDKYNGVANEYIDVYESIGVSGMLQAEEAKEETDLKFAIARSLNQGGHVEPKNQGTKGTVTRPPIQTYPDDALDENAQMDFAIALSLSDVESSNQGTSGTAAMPSNGTSQEEARCQKSMLQHSINGKLKVKENLKAQVALLYGEKHVKPINEGTNHAVAMSSNSGGEWDTMTEKAMLDRAITLSLAESRGEDSDEEDY
ncbi:hypothetical protein NHQ30_011519 [Ciborinia camelliae]|nr:hypothetical protein NHQ30_011519 [Ciborinia camelliae]